MAKSASKTSGATVTAKNPSAGEWVTIPLTSAAAKEIKAKISGLADQIAAAREELESLAKPWITAKYGAVPKGRELKFSHRFGLGFSFVESDGSKPAKAAKPAKDGI